MTREQARERVLDYAYGELSATEAEAFEAILREDPELRAELEAVTEVQQAASGLERPELPPAARNRILLAARRESHRRVMARRWEALQKLFLSPVLLGATAVIAAVGVGLHLIITQGTDDSWTRADREARLAVVAPAAPAPAASNPPGGEEPAYEDAPADAGARTVAEAAAPKPLQGPHAAVAAASAGVGRLGGAKAKGMSNAPAPRARAEALADMEGGLTGGGGYGAVGSGAVMGAGGHRVAGDAAAVDDLGSASKAVATGKAARMSEEQTLRSQVVQREKAAPAKEERSRFAEPPPSRSPDPPPMSSAMAVLSAPPEPSAAAAPSKVPARSPVAAMAVPSGAARADEAAGPFDRVAEARDLRSSGRLPEALATYRRALAAGPSGDLLADALSEAAEVAKALGRASEADGYLARLERLPGGPARAAKIRAK